jgi:hypothetical protein
MKLASIVVSALVASAGAASAAGPVDCTCTAATVSTDGLSASLEFQAGVGSCDAGLVDPCVDEVIATESGDAAASASVVLSGDPFFFADGNDLPAGEYRAVYKEGCMRYGTSASFEWSVHARPAPAQGFLITHSGGATVRAPGSIGFLGSGCAEAYVPPPGTTEADDAAAVTCDRSGFATVEACEEANRAGRAVVFTHAGGPISISLKDSRYDDNIVSDPAPAWTLQRLVPGCL